MRRSTLMSLVTSDEPLGMFPEEEARSGRRQLDLSKWRPFREAAKHRPVPADMVLPGLPAGTVGIIAGAGASSKSMLALQAAISVAAGADLFSLFGGAEIKAGRAVYLSMEDRDQALWRRQHDIAAAIEAGVRSGLMLDGSMKGQPEETVAGCIEEIFRRIEANLKVVDLHGQGMTIAERAGSLILPSEDLAQLAPMIEGARLVFADTLNKAASPAGLDENNSADMGGLLTAADTLCARTGCSFEPMTMAMKACQWHEQNDGPAVTHKDALIAVGMADPLRMGEAVTSMRKLTAADGEFHHLTEQRKYLETPARAAELGVDSGRSVAKPLDRKIKAVEDASKRIASMPHLSPEMLGHLNELSTTIVAGAARTQKAERTTDLIEWQKELAAKLNLVMLEVTKNAEKNEEKISHLEGEVQFLRDIVRRGGSAVPGAVVAA